jgi:hypothetical protein
MVQGEKTLERPSYWQDFVNTPIKGSASAKLSTHCHINNTRDGRASKLLKSQIKLKYFI